MPNHSIVVTGAGGKTGRAVIDRLVAAGVGVTALLHRVEHRAAAERAGARTVVADLADAATLAGALAGHDAVYHVPPNLHPAETELTAAVIAAAGRAGVQRFALHSVLAPYLTAMPHHLRKARSEELLRESPLDWTILQPASYAQNVLPYLDAIRDTGVWRLPYSGEARFTPVDLRDVAEVALRVLTETGHTYAGYELCGPELLDSIAMAARLETLLGRPVTVDSVPAAGAPDLVAMFDYYDRHGLAGNPRTLAGLLGRPPTDFATAVGHELRAVGADNGRVRR